MGGGVRRRRGDQGVPPPASSALWRVAGRKVVQPSSAGTSLPPPQRWYFNVKHLQYLKCREKLSLQLLQAVPHFGAALLHISRLGGREGSEEVPAQGFLCRFSAFAEASLFNF